MTLGQEFRKGFWRENAVFRLLLGLCPALAVTTSAENGIGMGYSEDGLTWIALRPPDVSPIADEAGDFVERDGVWYSLFGRKGDMAIYTSDDVTGPYIQQKKNPGLIKRPHTYFARLYHCNGELLLNHHSMDGKRIKRFPVERARTSTTGISAVRLSVPASVDWPAAFWPKTASRESREARNRGVLSIYQGYDMPPEKRSWYCRSSSIFDHNSHWIVPGDRDGVDEHIQHYIQAGPPHCRQYCGRHNTTARNGHDYCARAGDHRNSDWPGDSRHRIRLGATLA